MRRGTQATYVKLRVSRVPWAGRHAAIKPARAYAGNCGAEATMFTSAIVRPSSCSYRPEKSHRNIWPHTG